MAAAGYTVTRVFTPETERVPKVGQEAEGEEQKKEEGGIGTKVAGWIGHILSAAAHSATAIESSKAAPDMVEDAGSNPFLRPNPRDGDGVGAGTGHFPQTTRSLRTHLMSRALRSHPQPPRHGATIHPGFPARDDRTITHRQQPTLRHVTSAPSLPRAASGRRRALPSAWREQDKNLESGAQQISVVKAWSGGFVAKQTEVTLKPRRGWFGSPLAESTPNSTLRARSGSQPPRGTTSTHLRPPTIHRARSAPRPSRVQVPAPAPPVRPSPVVQPSVVVCRSVSSLGSSSSVQTRSSVKSKSRLRSPTRHDSGLGLNSDEEDEAPTCPVLTPEHTSPDGLPPTPNRPVLIKQRSNGFLKRSKPIPVPSEVDDEPDLASIIHAFRPPSAPPSPTRRQRSIRSLRALLKDPKFPDVPVVCVASPSTVSAGGPGRAVWLRGTEWDAASVGGRK